jgi:adenosylcobinamide-phosphate synthase
MTGDDSQRLCAAREAVSMIVGRDTECLDERGIVKAAVETVAENTSDGVIAPLFFMMIGGAAAGMTYKAVNTLDSMVAYRNDKYMFFGRASAVQDDIWNYLPSRLAALIMCLAAYVLKLDWKGAFRIWRRDSRNHESPNSAQTESACAGALSVQLGGDARYFGQIKHKKTIGDNIRDIEAEDIRRACRLMFGTECLMMVLVTVFRILLFFIF